MNEFYVIQTNRGAFFSRFYRQYNWEKQKHEENIISEAGLLYARQFPHTKAAETVVKRIRNIDPDRQAIIKKAKVVLVEP